MMTNDQELSKLIGKELGVSEWHEVTQDAVNLFGRVTHDEQWIHCDVDRASKAMPETGTIAHGYYTMSMISFLMGSVLKGKMPEGFRERIKKKINYGINKLRFTDVVPVGSRIRTRITINDIDDMPNGYKLTVGVVMETEGREKPALIAECVSMVSWK
jgi:acyl dehydratase